MYHRSSYEHVVQDTKLDIALEVFIMLSNVYYKTSARRLLTLVLNTLQNHNRLAYF